MHKNTIYLRDYQYLALLQHPLCNFAPRIELNFAWIETSPYPSDLATTTRAAAAPYVYIPIYVQKPRASAPLAREEKYRVNGKEKTKPSSSPSQSAAKRGNIAKRAKGKGRKEPDDERGGWGGEKEDEKKAVQNRSACALSFINKNGKCHAPRAGTPLFRDSAGTIVNIPTCAADPQDPRSMCMHNPPCTHVCIL